VDVAVRSSDHAGATESAGQFRLNAEKGVVHAVDFALCEFGGRPPPC
jgi:hypothetical protein